MSARLMCDANNTGLYYMYQPLAGQTSCTVRANPAGTSPNSSGRHASHARAGRAPTAQGRLPPVSVSARRALSDSGFANEVDVVYYRPYYVILITQLD